MSVRYWTCEWCKKIFAASDFHVCPKQPKFVEVEGVLTNEYMIPHSAYKRRPDNIKLTNL